MLVDQELKVVGRVHSVFLTTPKIESEDGEVRGERSYEVSGVSNRLRMLGIMSRSVASGGPAPHKTSQNELCFGRDGMEKGTIE